MPRNPPADTARPAPPRFLRRAVAPALAGLAGVLSLALLPVPAALLQSAPALAELPPWALRVVLLLNPLLLVVAAAVAGAWLAHRAGLGSLLAGTAADPAPARTFGVAAALGVACGVVLGALDAVWAPALGEAWQRLQAAPQPAWPGLAIGVLYGGLAEEVTMRWGLMAALAAGIAAVSGGRGRTAATWVAIVAAALVFGAAHLPALAAQIEPTPAIVLRTLLLNGLAGLLYGLLFWRRHLEAAMAAHAATHLGMAAWRGLAA